MILGKADIFLNNINLFILLMEMQYIYCEEGPESPHTSYNSDQFHASKG